MAIIAEAAPFLFWLGLVAFIGYSLWLPFRKRVKHPKSPNNLRSLNHFTLSIWRLLAMIGLIIGLGASGNNIRLCVLGFIILGASICYIKYYKFIFTR